jgi:hypothetical protein
MRKRKVIIALVITGVACVAAAWWFGWLGSDPALAEVQQMQSQLADPNLKDDARRALMEQMRNKMSGLSPDARRTVMDANRAMFEQRAVAHMKEVLAMSQADQAKALDADIDRMQKMRAQMQANSQNNQAANNNQNNGARQRNRTQPTTDDQRVARLRNRLDRSTPEMRAFRTAYTQLMNQRLQQRGLPTMPTGRS